MSGDIMVRLQGVTKRFAHVWALRGIDLELRRGRCLGIFGANGAGKTTLLNILATLTRPSSGQVTIAGYDAVAHAQKIRPLLGVLGHRTYLYGDLTAIENLQFYGRLFGLINAYQRSQEMLLSVGLDPDSQQRVRTFSRGMQQRLAIARVLLHEPELLLLDEPYTGLDQQAVGRFQRLLDDLQAAERTIILSTHDLPRGLAVCDEVLIQSRGKIVYYHAAASDLNITGFEQLYAAHVQ
jgi:ABC-type multidrug transport system ATPase subunit